MNIINAYARGYLTRRLMRTERVITLKKIYKEALHCMLKLHVDAPLNLAEVNFLHRLQLQVIAASLLYVLEKVPHHLPSKLGIQHLQCDL